MAFFKVIVKEPDGFERLVLATADQKITESEVLWDERASGEPPANLLDKANQEDEKRKQAIAQAEAAKQNRLLTLEASLSRPGASQDVKDLVELLKARGLI